MMKILEDSEDIDESDRCEEEIADSCQFCKRKKEICKKFYPILKACDVCSPSVFINRWFKTNILHDLIITMYLDPSCSLYKFAKKYDVNYNTIKGITKRFRDANENGFHERINADSVVNPDWDQKTDTTRTNISFGELEEGLQFLLDVIRDAKESDEFLPRDFFKS